MAQITVNGTATAIPVANALVQNLGPGILYLGDAGVTSANGLKVDVGKAVSVTNAAGLFGVATGGSSDVRTLPQSTGIHSLT